MGNVMELQDKMQPKFVPERNLKLIDQVRQVLRYHTINEQDKP